MVSKQFWILSQSPIAWSGVSISVPTRAMASHDNIEKLLELATNWGLAKNACLPACPLRHSLELGLQNVCPKLSLTIVGYGPFLMFVMACHLQVGKRMGLHFFEPRYRWMCRRILAGEPPFVFGFVTRGGAQEGSTGVLCEISQHVENVDGTFDVYIVAKAAFTLMEVRHEELPDNALAPKLGVGFVDFANVDSVPSEILGMSERCSVASESVEEPLRQVTLTPPTNSLRWLISKVCRCSCRRR